MNSKGHDDASTSGRPSKNSTKVCDGICRKSQQLLVFSFSNMPKNFVDLRNKYMFLVSVIMEPENAAVEMNSPYGLPSRQITYISVYVIIIIEASYSFFFQSFTCDLSMLSDSCIVYYSMVISNCCHPYCPIYLGKNPTELSDKCKHQPLVVKEQTDRGLN